MTTPGDPNLVSTDRLEALEDEIDDIRQRVDDPLDQGDNTFIEGDGTGPGEGRIPQDDTIVPPG